jgi:hypothetical protein
MYQKTYATCDSEWMTGDRCDFSSGAKAMREKMKNVPPKLIVHSHVNVTSVGARDPTYTTLLGPHTRCFRNLMVMLFLNQQLGFEVPLLHQPKFAPLVLHKVTEICGVSEGLK